MAGSALTLKTCEAGYELVPGGQDQLVPEKCVGRVGAGPRRHDQLMPKKTNCGATVRAGPRRRDQLGPPQAKVHENFGEARAGPRTWDQLGTTPVKTHENLVLFGGGPTFGRGPS